MLVVLEPCCPATGLSAMSVQSTQVISNPSCIQSTVYLLFVSSDSIVLPQLLVPLRCRKFNWCIFFLTEPSHNLGNSSGNRKWAQCTAMLLRECCWSSAVGQVLVCYYMQPPAWTTPWKAHSHWRTVWIEEVGRQFNWPCIAFPPSSKPPRPLQTDRCISAGLCFSESAQSHQTCV